MNISKTALWLSVLVAVLIALKLYTTQVPEAFAAMKPRHRMLVWTQDE